MFSFVVLVTSFSVHSKDISDVNCAECSTAKNKVLEGQPNNKPINDLVASTAQPINLAKAIKKDGGAVPKSAIDSYLLGFCMQYQAAQDTVDVETLFEEMEQTPYASKDYWTTPACRAPLKTDTAVPIIFNTASNAPKNENFPKVVHDYFVNDKKDPQTWLKVINTKTSDGLTFLDFMQYNLGRGHYDSVKASKDAALRIVAYICKNGGVYSKYKDSAKCP